MSQPSVMMVGDDPELLHALSEALRFRMSEVMVDTANSTATAVEQIGACDYAAIVIDIELPGMDGLALLAELRTHVPDTPTLIITGHCENDLVLRALRGGACDFIRKPIDRDYFIGSLHRAIRKHQVSRAIKGQSCAVEPPPNKLDAVVDTRKLRETNKSTDGHFKCLIGANGPMEKVVQQINQVADTPLSVLIEGETGTGKELVARAIHRLSARRKKPFVAIDCGAIPETLMESELFGFERGAFTGAHQRKTGHFQLAVGGTLFLDEIVNLPFHTQAKLLRTLQERQIRPLGGKHPTPVDVRIIAASNIPLEHEVQAARFRQDVYYRLNEFRIALSPLREREDILYLANEFLLEAGMELGRPCRNISEAAAQVLLRYPWPGNVRELRNVIRRAVLLASDVIEPEHLSITSVDSTFMPEVCGESTSGGSPKMSASASLKEIAEAAAAEAEEQAIRRVLQATEGNKSRAARLLKTDYKTLHLKMKQYGISAPQFKRSLSRMSERSSRENLVSKRNSGTLSGCI